jgi:uncharacterized DUF497 family protein
VKITFDPGKRDRTLRERGLDFADAGQLFAAEHFTAPDERFDYGEPRLISAGYIHDRMVVTVWTPRGGARHIISMRYCHADEEKLWRERMDRQG